MKQTLFSFAFTTAAATNNLSSYGNLLLLVLWSFGLSSSTVPVDAFLVGNSITSSSHPLFMTPSPPDRPAGSFFHSVPNSDGNDDKEGEEPSNNYSIDDLPFHQTNEGRDDTMRNAVRDKNNSNDHKNPSDRLDDALFQLIRQRRKQPLASQPSTINGIPTTYASGFGKLKNGKRTKPAKLKLKPYVAIGRTSTTTATNHTMLESAFINNPSRPQLDDQGYTLYTDEETGEISRVFEALIDYPCSFTMKIVGANEGTFVQDMVAMVADATQTEVRDISYTIKAVGSKWASITVLAPVQSSEMLYALYERVDLDPRVKFKF